MGREGVASRPDTPLRVLFVGPELAQRGGIATYFLRVIAAAPAGVEARHVATHAEGSAVHRVGVFLRGWATVVGRSARGRDDVVHVIVSDGGSLVRKAVIVATARALRRRVVLHTQGAEPTKPFLGRRFLQPLVFAGLRRAHRGIALTRHWADWYTEHWGGPTWEVLHNPGPPVDPASPPEDGPIRVVALGRLGERKGTFVVLDAFASLPEEVRAGAELVLAGDGEVDRARETAVRLGIADHVVCPGWLDEAARDAILHRSHVFVLPSRAEGLPLALVEAMAAGVVPVVSDIVGVDEVVHDGENGVLVPPDDPVALAAALEPLLTDPDLRARMAAATLATAATLDVHAHWHRLLAVYARAGATRSSTVHTQAE